MLHKFFMIRDERSLRYLPAVLGGSQVLCLLNELWNKEAPGSRRLPESEPLRQAFGLALRHSRFALLDSLVDAEGRVARVVLRTRDMPARAYLDLLGAVSEFAEEELPEGVTLRARQGIHTLLAADRRLVASQLGSLGTCLGLVAVTLTV